MKKMRLLTIAATATLILANEHDIVAQTNATNSPNPASTPSMEDRVGKLEGNINQILTILKNQQGQGANSSGSSQSSQQTPSQSPATTSLPAVKYVPGAVLDVWPLRPGYDGDFPTSRSVASVVDSGPAFGLSNYLKLDVFNSLYPNPLAFQWTGYISLKEKGTYSFLVEGHKAEGKSVSEDNYGNGSGGWFIELDISDNIVISETSPRMNLGGKAMNFPITAQIDLTPGIYMLKLKTYITKSQGAINWDYTPLFIMTKMRTPSDSIPIPFTRSNVFHVER